MKLEGRQARLRAPEGPSEKLLAYCLLAVGSCPSG